MGHGSVLVGSSQCECVMRPEKRFEKWKRENIGDSRANLVGYREVSSDIVLSLCCHTCSAEEV